MSEFGSKYRLTRVLGNGGTSIVFHGEVNAHLGLNGYHCYSSFLSERGADVRKVLS